MTGGSNHASVPDGGGEDILLCAAVALTTGSACSVLFQVPNEPIAFTSEHPPKQRTEDAIIAYTWQHFLDNPNEPEWLLRLPMTKAAVRCMDATTEFLNKHKSMNVKEFIVAGASKRGWTTWTTAAVDKRVIAAIPIVMDLLNMHENIHHFWRAYGGWSFALKDYYELNFTSRLDDPNFPKMAAIIDPISYKDRLTMPKLVIDSTGDEFFMNDDNWFWWGELKGETHLLMVHNAEHSLATNLVEVIEGISSFTHDVLADVPRPSMTWNMTNSTTGGSIVLETSEEPSRVTVRWADTLNHTRRDWRLVIGSENCPYIKVSGNCIQPVLWSKEDAVKIDATHYKVEFDVPPAGWRAFLLDVSSNLTAPALLQPVNLQTSLFYYKKLSYHIHFKFCLRRISKLNEINDVYLWFNCSFAGTLLLSLSLYRFNSRPVQAKSPTSLHHKSTSYRTFILSLLVMVKDAVANFFRCSATRSSYPSS